MRDKEAKRKEDGLCNGRVISQTAATPSFLSLSLLRFRAVRPFTHLPALRAN